MFSGLILTSISTVVVRAALFQRKARSGWLEELDGIREDALVSSDGEVGEIVDGDDIWTDLRAGGEYADPHEISSLYATDETPDLPAPRPAKTPRPSKARPARSKASRPDPHEPAPSTEPTALADLPPAPAPIVDERSAAHLPPPPAPPAPLPTTDPVALAAEPVGTDVGPAFETEPMWVQPAPHPIRPSEMWHPAELAPPSLGEELAGPVAEERVSSAELGAPSVAPVGFVPFDTVPAASVSFDGPAAGAAAVDLGSSAQEEVIDAQRAAELETQLVASADLTVLEGSHALPVAPEDGIDALVNGPVGRRVRRDRPVGRPEALPTAPRDDDRSPLPEHPLPPAALPVRGPRPAAAPLAEAVAAAPPVPVPVEQVPVEQAPVEQASIQQAPVEPVPVAAIEVVAEPVPVATPVPAPTAVPIVPASDGVLEVPGTIVRLGGARRAGALLDPDGLAVDLAEGWVWVAPGDGSPTSVRIGVPQCQIAVSAASTVLAVVEADGSSFVVVAAGAAELRRGEDATTLTRGAIAMFDGDGGAQVDQADDAEIEADPLVAENLALDAEL